MARPSKLLAEWFWTDRWMGSSGFLLPIGARGLYREMLTQAWRRSATLPADHQMIQRAVGVTPEEWAENWPLIKKYWKVDGEEIFNETQREIYEESASRADSLSNRGKTAAEARWAASRTRQASTEQCTSNAQALPEQCPPSPSPSPSPDQSPTPSLSPIHDHEKNPPTPLAGGRDIGPWFSDFWNEHATKTLPSITRLGSSRLRGVKALLHAAGGNRESVERAVAAFSSWPFAIEKGLNVDTFLRAKTRDKYLEWGVNGPPSDNGSRETRNRAAIMEYAKRRFGNAGNMDQ